MLFCFLVQNVLKIGKSVDELWPKKRFLTWRPPPCRILKISIFGHVPVIGFDICSGVPNFIKIWHFFSLRYGDLMIFKMAAVRHVGFLKKLQFLSRGLSLHAVCPRTTFCWNRTIGWWVVGMHAIFKMAAAAVLNFNNFNFFVTWLSSGSISAVVYQISSKSDVFSLRYGDLMIFKMAAVCHLGF